MKTHSVTPKDITKKWVIVDAADRTVGRVATEIARLLRGKNKPTFTPYLDCGDNVIVLNAAKVRFSGNKMEDKFYYHHTGYVGGIKAISAEDLLAKNPERLLTLTVKGMLPKNKLSRKLMTNLRVYAGNEHEQAAQNPVPAPSRVKDHSPKRT